MFHKVLVFCALVCAASGKPAGKLANFNPANEVPQVPTEDPAGSKSNERFTNVNRAPRQEQADGFTGARGSGRFSHVKQAGRQEQAEDYSGRFHQEQPDDFTGAKGIGRLSHQSGNEVQRGYDFAEANTNRIAPQTKKRVPQGHYVDYQAEEDSEHDDNDYHGHAKYKYGYNVNDEKTGDFKSHTEERDGDTVRGEYVVADPDGTIRTVTYTADAKNGFQAIVKTTKNHSPFYQTEAPPEEYQPRPTNPPRHHNIVSEHKYHQDRLSHRTRPVFVPEDDEYQYQPAVKHFSEENGDVAEPRKPSSGRFVPRYKTQAPQRQDYESQPEYVVEDQNGLDNMKYYEQ